jgi:hypothetical protein
MAITRAVNPATIQSAKEAGLRLRERIAKAAGNAPAFPPFRIGPSGELLDDHGNVVEKKAGTKP